MRSRIFAVVLSVVLWRALPCALYLQVEVRQVPVTRLLSNLEAALKADPKNADAEINIARLYGMAYALRSDQVPAAVYEPGRPERPWYGYKQDLIPYSSPRLSPDDQPAARDYLLKAIAHYEAALTLDPENLLARLGHGWTLDQAGRKTEAIAEYRRVIDRAWLTEKAVSSGGLKPFYTEEAARYLVELLDPQADGDELRELRDRLSKLQQLPRAVTPIVIPLDDRVDPSDIADATAHVRFDADGSGLRRRWTWISSRTGWLVHDAPGTGRITSALQWFGSVTFWLFWQNGYAALAALDDNRDGELTGKELAHLAIWRDANRNGVSEPGEVLPLAAYNVVALSCRAVSGDRQMFAAVSPQGVRFASGATRPTYDVILRSTTIGQGLTRRQTSSPSLSAGLTQVSFQTSLQTLLPLEPDDHIRRFLREIRPHDAVARLVHGFQEVHEVPLGRERLRRNGR